MLNGLSWSPTNRKKRGGSRQANAKLVALALFKVTPVDWSAPRQGVRSPKRLRLRLRTSLTSYYKRPPLVSALLSALLPQEGFYQNSKFPGQVVPKPGGAAPLRAAPTYLRVNKASKPARAVLRFFYLFIANPTPSVVAFANSPSL